MPFIANIEGREEVIRLLTQHGGVYKGDIFLLFISIGNTNMIHIHLSGTVLYRRTAMKGEKRKITLIDNQIPCVQY